MTRMQIGRLALIVVLVAVIAGGLAAVVHLSRQASRNHVVAYFENTNGVFVGDDVRIRGVTVGKIDKIEPQPTTVKVTFWFEDKYKVPADANAVILSPTLVTARAIQLTPHYTGGATMQDDAVIGSERTAVPVEWDDVREQLEKLTTMLRPTRTGGVSTLGDLVNTTADNLRGQGSNIRNAVIELSQTLSALNDHSSDTFTTIKNLSKLVTALEDSTVVMRQLNQNLASSTALLANGPQEVGNAIKDLNGVVNEVTTFVAENKETVGTTSEKLAAVSTTLNESLDDIEQVLHILPTTISNGVNLYQPAQGTLTGAAVINNFSDPITFLCGAVQAASRLRAEESAKLCVQYLAPIVKNRQYNFPPIGMNPFVGPSVRPNEVTYSEDWMRPDYIPPQPPPTQTPQPSPAQMPQPLPAEATDLAPAQQTDPAAGLPGLMVQHGAGS